MREESVDWCPVVGGVAPAGHHHSVQLVRTVDWLVQSEALQQVGLHLEGVDVREGLLRPGENLPHGDSPGPDITGWTPPPTEGFYRHPLDGSVLVVPQTVIVRGEEILAEGRVTQLH